jgi:hypothetical protein
MLYNSFKKISKNYWDTYFNFIANNQANIKSTGAPLFPSYIIFMNFGKYIGFELLGADIDPKPLRLKTAKYKDVHDYFNLFKDDIRNPHFLLTSTGVALEGLCLAHESDISVAQERFPFIELYPTKLVRKNGSGSVIEFGQGFKDVYLERCTILNHKEGLFRCKNILFSAIFSKKISNAELKFFFSNLLEPKEGENFINIHGIFTSEQNKKSILKASQLQNLYLSSGVHETTIGDFLNQSPEILKLAFKTDNFVHEPLLDWLEHDGLVKEKSINPDLFIKRDDGKYDIVDLKLALLNKKAITTDQRARRKFIATVINGIAQLANYKFYFSFEKNRNHAYEKYGIEIENPNLILVVGSMENVNKDTVIEALRLHEGMSIIDYDTLVSAYLLADQ